MKAVILAGGLQSTVSEETVLKPKPWLKLEKSLFYGSVRYPPHVHCRLSTIPVHYKELRFLP